MDDVQNLVAFDAQAALVNINDILPKKIRSLQLNCVLDDISVNEYKSMLFLLMDYVGDEFINIIKQDKAYLRQKLEDVLQILNHNSIIIELLGTLKLYKKLKSLGTCYHVFEKLQHKKFNKIEEVWKMLYSLCEELTDIDLEIFRQVFPEEQIETSEEWFYWALKKKFFSKTDFSKLEGIFHNYQRCLDIIKNFEKPKSYEIRTSTSTIHCGIAVILNFETFNGIFAKREGSHIDVKSLTDVWNTFGFKTEIHNNLTFEDIFTLLKSYADLDHSSYDAFVCCILSHGRQNCVISSDAKEIPIPCLIGEITRCTTLNSKPKLFFIQACQGTHIQQGFGKPIIQLLDIELPHIPGSTTMLPVPPITSDVFQAISSIDGYVSFRDTEKGSWFIQDFCTVMKQKGDKFSILDVMIEVNNTVREKQADLGPGKPRNAKQIVNCQNTFGKRLILRRRTK